MEDPTRVLDLDGLVMNLDRMHDPRPPGGGGMFLDIIEGDTVGNKG